MLGKETRQAMGCGWEPKDPKIPVQPWSPSSLAGNDTWRCISKDTPEPTVCPGFSCSLPETIEIARAHTHWATGGGLRDYCDTPTDVLRTGVEMINGSIAECQRWSMENPVPK